MIESAVSARSHFGVLRDGNATSRSNSECLTFRSEANLKVLYRKAAGIPTPQDFPYTPSDAWMAAAPRLPSIFSYNPIRHSMDRFLVDETGNMRQYKTDRVDPYLEPSVKDNIHFNRKKGVVEYADLTRLTNPRYSPEFNQAFSENPKVFRRITGSFSRLYDVAVKNKEKNPFRVGR